MRERDIEKTVTKHAKLLGWLCFKFSSPGQRGVPDRIYFKDGTAVLIEFKAPGKRPTKLQLKTIENLKEKGITTHVIDSIETGKAVFTA